MRVYMIGVSGTGMASLASLFRETGHEVSGSDVRFDPPMGDVLRDAGVTCLTGFDAAHLAGDYDLVVVGNAIRRDNPEAEEAERRGLARVSMSQALRERFLVKRRALVVCGTHGKTTTSAMAAHVLVRAEQEPGYFIGGVIKGFPRSASVGNPRRKLTAPGPSGATGSPSPFVVEGDEYDAVYWKKQPKFLDYVGVSDGDVVILTSIELDHVDIYADATAYEDAFRALVARIPANGVIVGDARDPRVRAVVADAKARVVYYALEGDDTGGVTPSWLGATVAIDEAGTQPFDLFAGGVACGRFALRVPGAHNVRDAIAATAACAEGFGVPISTARTALLSFDGVRRRQDLLGEPGGVRVYDDFAHHPTAVDETLRALRAKHPKGTLWAVFEPRSATACRSLHQEAYAEAFGAADRVLFAPLGRTNIPPGERLDLERPASALGTKAEAVPSIDAIVKRLASGVRAGDTVALLSNGAFGGLSYRLVASLARGEKSSP